MQRDPNLTAMEAEILQECAGLRPTRPWSRAVNASLDALCRLGYVNHVCEITPLGREQAKLWPLPGDDGKGERQ